MSTRRLAESVEGLNSSLALVADDLWPKKGRPIAVVKGFKYKLALFNFKQSLINIHYTSFTQKCYTVAYTSNRAPTILYFL